MGIVPPMSEVVSSEVVSPFPTWLTYHQVAERMGLRTANAAAARARRAKWPKRIRNDTLEVEVCVPAEALVAGPPKAGERSHPRDRADENLQTTAEAVAAAVAPLQSIIESLSGELNAAHGANDALRDQVAAARATTAEFRGKSMAIEAALERGLAEQRDLQQQVVHLRREYQSVQERVVQAQGEAFDERRLRLSTEDLLTRLKYELSELRQASERRRWWRRR
jgi:chromosome segregation ATPase